MIIAAYEASLSALTAQFFAQRFPAEEFCKPMFPARIFAGFASEKPSFGEEFV
ncbi:hypothetical protein NXC24_PC00524 (plasmid) [Rhizobium sp. NXC24]|nr:hypothetical protein NXC24_PC00524 [Rhizobium sp. NXC24]